MAGTAFAQSPLRPGVLDDITDVASVAALRKQVRTRARKSFDTTVAIAREAEESIRIPSELARVSTLQHVTSKPTRVLRRPPPTRRDTPRITIGPSHNRKFVIF